MLCNPIMIMIFSLIKLCLIHTCHAPFPFHNKKHITEMMIDLWVSLLRHASPSTGTVLLDILTLSVFRVSNLIQLLVVHSDVWIFCKSFKDLLTWFAFAHRLWVKTTVWRWWTKILSGFLIQRAQPSSNSFGLHLSVVSHSQFSGTDLQCAGF